MQNEPPKSNVQEAGAKPECGHKEGTTCLKCAERTFRDFIKKESALKEAYEKLEQRLEIFRGRSERPLCWTCRFSTCLKMLIPNGASFMNSLEKRETWHPEESQETKAIDVWQTVCSFPGHVPGLLPNKFMCLSVLDCNNFEERKDKTKVKKAKKRM